VASVAFRQVIKRYGVGSSANPVIHGLTADIADGEFVVVVGPSGCGKSTLLRMVAGLEELSGGAIAIDGQTVNSVEPAKRDIAMVFQNYALYPHMSVFDNMAYGLRIRKLSQQEIETRVAATARMLELEPLLRRRPAQLSGGQRQRVAMGRAIVRQPRVFLFDEPLSNLDAKLRAQTRVEIQKLHRSLGVTSLFVTHDQVEAMTLAQRMMVMNAGHLEQFATPDEVYQRPASIFVAGFMGAPPMNLLRHAQGVPATAVLGVRPEHLKVSRQGWETVVESVELLGAERLLYLRLGAEELSLRLPASEAYAAVGTRIFVEPLPSAVHHFDRQSGKRLP